MKYCALLFKALSIVIAVGLAACAPLRNVSSSPPPALVTEGTATVEGAISSYTVATEPTLDPIEQEAADVLRNFLTLLHFRHYQDAALLYAGSSEDLLTFLGPEAGSMEPGAIWQRICDEYYLQCLLPKDVKPGAHTDASIEFRVSFFNPDGSTFTVGPCCGADPTSMPPVSDFPFTVVLSDGAYRIVGTPPYVP